METRMLRRMFTAGNKKHISANVFPYELKILAVLNVKKSDLTELFSKATF